MKLIIPTVVCFLMLSASALAQTEGGGRLTGTFDTVITIRVCNTGAAITSFQSVGSFNQGGTFSGITSGMPPTLRTSERGSWRHLNANLYRFKFKAYLYNAAAVAIGYQIVTHDLELDQSAAEWTSSGTSETFLMDGTPTGTGCSTAEGIRMVLD